MEQSTFTKPDSAIDEQSIEYAKRDLTWFDGSNSNPYTNFGN